MPYVDYLFPQRILIARHLWQFLGEIGFIPYLLNIFSKMFYKPTKNFLFLHNNTLHLLPKLHFFVLYAFIVIGIFASYIRLLLSGAILAYSLIP